MAWPMLRRSRTSCCRFALPPFSSRQAKLISGIGCLFSHDRQVDLEGLLVELYDALGVLVEMAEYEDADS
eukprot:1739471-Pyramimonas_sp.AAC.1